MVDGTGAPSRVADVGVRDGRVVAVGDLDEEAARVIDATGRVVCPGFIDIHTHYDAQLLWDPTASPSVQHGVTTVIGGNCGFSIAPLGPGDAEYVQSMMAVVEGMPRAALLGGGPWTWRTFAEYLDRLDVGLSVNAGFLVGHSTVRRVVMGEAASSDRADAGQLAGHGAAGGGVARRRCPRVLVLAGRGAPGRRPPAGAVELCRVRGVRGARRRAARTTTGPRSSSSRPSDPIPEDRVELMADMSLAADRPLNWNLLGSLASEEIWEEQLRASDVAAARGAHVVALALPDMMRMRSNTLLPGLPGWRDVLALDGDGRRAAAADPGTRAQLRAGAEKVAERAIGVLTDFAMMEVADPGSPWVGRSLGSIAAERGTDVIDVLIDVVLPDDLTLYVVLPSLTPSLGQSDAGWAARVAIWKDPRVLLGGSDAGAHLDLMCHANYPTRVLGEVVRRPRPADRRGGGGHDDRPAGPPLRTDGPGPHRGRGATPTWSCSTRTRSTASRPAWWPTCPAGASAWWPTRPGSPRAGGRGRGGGRRAGPPAPGPDGPAVGGRHRDGPPGRRQAVAAPSMTRVVPLTVRASSEAR